MYGGVLSLIHPRTPKGYGQFKTLLFGIVNFPPYSMVAEHAIFLNCIAGLQGLPCITVQLYSECTVSDVIKVISGNDNDNCVRYVFEAVVYFVAKWF